MDFLTNFSLFTHAGLFLTGVFLGIILAEFLKK